MDTLSLTKEARIYNGLKTIKIILKCSHSVIQQYQFSELTFRKEDKYRCTSKSDFSASKKVLSSERYSANEMDIIYDYLYADDTTLMAESEEELKSLLMKMKEKSEKFGLKLNIQKINIMASNPITSWQIDGERVETVVDFIFLAPKSLQVVIAAMKLKDAYSLEGKL